MSPCSCVSTLVTPCRSAAPSPTPKTKIKPYTLFSFCYASTIAEPFLLRPCFSSIPLVPLDCFNSLTVSRAPIACLLACSPASPPPAGRSSPCYSTFCHHFSSRLDLYYYCFSLFGAVVFNFLVEAFFRLRLLVLAPWRAAPIGIQGAPPVL